MSMFYARLCGRIRRDLPSHSQMYEQGCRSRVSICAQRTGTVYRRKPQQHEFPVALDGFDPPARKMLFERSLIINEIRFSQPDGQDSPADNRSPQPARYCFDFRKFWHEGIANKITHPLTETQASHANPLRFARLASLFSSHCF